MKLKLKEDPREWRKSVLLAIPALFLIASLLRWRKAISPTAWLEVVIALALWGILAVAVPRAFRGYYRLSMRVGYVLSQAVARVVLVIVFALIITPLALLFRIAGKDSLRLKRTRSTDSYWSEAKQGENLDAMF